MSLWNNKQYNDNPAVYPAEKPNSVVVSGNGKPLATKSSSSASSLQKIIDSGVPLTSGNSGSQVNNTSVDLLSGLQDALGQFANSFGSLTSGLTGSVNSGFEGLFNLIKQNTAQNNAWSAAQAQKQMDYQTQANQIAMDFSAQEAAKNRDWQRLMSNTAHQREVNDLKKAGLNPILSATGGNGAAVTSGSAASGVTSSGAQGDADQSANASLAAIYGALIDAQTSMYNSNLSAQTNLRMAEMQKEASLYGAELAASASMANAQTAAEASKYAAGTNYAAAKYGYDNQAQMQRENLDYQSTHPNSAWQAVNTVLDTVFGDKKGSTSAKQSGVEKAWNKIISIFG